ncbi:hypothetical protein L0F63_001090 [Massospora cicadina]|nr:hypothetical protein L0F63_001090 [Massospora cicadina]
MLGRHEGLIEAITPRDSVNSILRKVIAEGELEAFNVLDVGEVNHRLALWERNLPNVMPFYAVKALPDPRLIQRMADLGMGFDCASPSEIELVLAAGVSPDRIIFANPCKLKSHMRHAANCGIQMNTFDSANELDKIKALWPFSQLFLRIWVDDSGSSIPLNTKYGAAPNEIYSILAKAKELELDVVGISFHVGSNCLNPNLFTTAIRSAKQAFLVAQGLGFKMTTLNLGAAAAIRTALAESFPTGIRAIAEPGRYFSSPPSPARAPSSANAYVPTFGNSAFGIFAEGIFPQKIEFIPTPLHLEPTNHQTEGQLYPTIMWGPTCTSQDTICLNPTLKLPELEIGDWFYVKDVGAYSLAMGFTFNGFQPVNTYYIDTAPKPPFKKLA